MSFKNLLKKSLCMLLVCIMAVGILASCGDSSTPSTSADTAESGSASEAGDATEGAPVAESDETLTFVLEVEPTTLTNLNNASTLQVFAEAITSSLLEYNDETKTADPALAESYEMIDDTHYRFVLRDDAVFADGSPVTSQDVLYSFTKYKEMGVQDIMPIDVENFVIEDDKTFILALERYTIGWEFSVAQGSSAIYSEALVEAAGGVDAVGFAPLGCGEYIVSEWKPGEHLLLERNENYWDPEYVGYYKYIKFTFNSDSAARVMAVRSGDADIANRIGIADYISLENDPSAYGWAYDAGVVNNVYYNCESGPLVDAKLREAVTYAIDPEAVNAVMNLGLGEVAQALWPKSFPYYKEYYDGTLYNPEKSKEMLAELGYDESNPLVLNCIIFPTFKDAATVIQESLRQVGVDLQVNMMDNATWTPLVRAGEYDVTLGNTAIASINVSMFNHVDPAKMGASAFNIRMDTPEMNAVMEAVNTPDEEARLEAFDDLYEIVFGQYTVAGLCNGEKYMAVGTGITGLKVGNTYGFVDVTDCRPE